MSSQLIKGATLCALAGTWFWLSAGCGEGGEPNPSVTAPGALRGFDSEEELQAYLDQISLRRDERKDDGATAVSEGASPAPQANENVTNNQEVGVDEGGIVKNIGEHLVVLRKGRLYAVSVSLPGAPTQTDSIRVAPKEELNQNVWYDEMLVDGNLIYVIGYRYLTNVLDASGTTLIDVHGATEVSLFRLVDGKLARGATKFLQSSDYYSGDNYASRLVGGKLVFYMPQPAVRRDASGRSATVRFPQVLEHVAQDTFRSTGQLFGWQDVTRPLQLPESPVFHSVTRCELSATQTLDCQSKALLSSWAREFYVTPSHVFLWTEQHLYSVEQGNLSVRAHAVRGAPLDQFSFRQDGETLHVLVTEYPRHRQSWAFGGESDGLKAPAANRPPRLLLLSLPLPAFDDQGGQTLGAGTLRELYKPGGSFWLTNNRFAEGWVLGSVEGDESPSPHRVIAHSLQTGVTQWLAAKGRVTRFEAMPGMGLLSSSTSSAELHLQPFLTSSASAFQAGVDLAGTREGEWRSHGFFFHPDGQGGGHFGLPVVAPSAQHGAWWGPGVSNVAFFRAEPSGTLSTLGAVSATPASTGACETSCVDWYGNTRPIFLGGRVFALMGSELQELTLSSTGVSEQGARLALTLPAQ